MEDLEKYLPLITAAALFADALCGYLPDKWVRYIGIVRKCVNLFLGARGAKK